MGICIGKQTYENAMNFLSNGHGIGSCLTFGNKVNILVVGKMTLGTYFF